VLVECFGRCLPAEDLAGSIVERVSDGLEVVGGPARQVGAFGEVLPQQTLVFSFVGRCQGECGSAKNTRVPVSNANCA
jgi:hypothetical protein